MEKNQTMPWLRSYGKVQKKMFRQYLRVLGSQGLTHDNASGLWHWGFYELDLRASQKLSRVLGDIEFKENFGFRKLKVLLLSDDTCDYVTDGLLASGLKHGLLVQGFNEKLNMVYSSIARGAGLDKSITDSEFAVLWPNPGIRFQSTDAKSNRESVIEEELSRVTAVATALMKKGVMPILTMVPPHVNSSLNGSDVIINWSEAWMRAEYNARIVELTIKNAWPLWNLENLVSNIGTERFHDPTQYNWAKLAVSMEYTMRTADNITTVLASLTGKTRRALVLDLDNTLWGGVIGDDGMEGIRIGQGDTESEAFSSLQHTILEIKSRGVMLAICSKNTDEIAREPFEKHPEMLLKLDDVPVFKANWKDKASNIVEIAKELNLGLGSLAFIDDNPVERDLVREFLPEVAVIEVGNDPAYYCRHLLSCGYFEHAPLNDEDKKRIQTFNANIHRQSLLEEIGDYTQYLKSLKMEMELEPFNEIGRSRVVQLINKSNQFNLTTRRYSAAEIEAMQNAADFFCYQIRFKDKFSDYGIISVIICERLADKWHIDTWLMSCRVLERGLENAIFNELVNHCANDGCLGLVGEYIPTRKNVIIRDLYKNLGLEKVPVEFTGLSSDKHDPNAIFYYIDVGSHVEANHQILVKNAI